MSTIINARSPYYIKTQATGQIDGLVTYSIYIYDKILTTDKPTTPTYVITKLPFDTGLTYSIIEISELIRDYLYTKYYTEAVDAAWVEITATYEDNTTPITTNYTFLAFDGFGFFNEGINPRESTDPTQSSYTPMVLQDNVTVYFVKGEDIRIPLFSEPQPNVVTTIGSGVWNEVELYWENAQITWDATSVPQTIVDSNDTREKIQYLIIESDYVADGDKITITSTTGNAQQTIITLRELCDPKYTPVRIIFYNKYGALQDIYANKKHKISMKIKDETYKANTIDIPNFLYSINDPMMQRFHVEANESIEVNTDFYVEELNNPIKQMLVSENIWLEIDGDIIPVLIKETSFNEKTHVNDKLIQYSFKFDYAFDYIQNVR